MYGFVVFVIVKTMAGRPMMMDNDQYNRIFIIGIGDVSTADIRKAFEQFGNITDVYMPRSKSSQETKGELSWNQGTSF